MAVPLYTRSDCDEVFKYCCGYPLEYLNTRYFTPQDFASAYFGLFGTLFDVVYKSRTTEEKYYYPLIISYLQVIDIIDQYTIPADVLSDIKNNNCKILVMCPFEGWEWDWWMDLINPIQQKYNLTLDRFVFVNANLAENDQIKHVYHNFWELQPLHQKLHFFLTQGNLFWDNRGYKPYKFICLNRRPHAGRIAAVTLLQEYSEQGLLSLGINGQMRASYFEEQEEVFKKNYSKIYEQYSKNNIRSAIPLSIPNNIDPIDVETSNPVHDVCIDKFYNSYLHICPETYQYHCEGRQFFSEKIFKAIMFMQPFVIIGEPYSIKSLQKLGYKTFGDVIDESYDDIIDNETRLIKAVNSAVEFFSKPAEELHEICMSLKDRLSHNICHLQYRGMMVDIHLENNLQKYLLN